MLEPGDTSVNVIRDLGLAVCTRNRSHLLRGLVDNLATAKYLPIFFLIVDSSDEDIHIQQNQTFAHELVELIPTVYILRDQPGLPRQRNSAISWARQHFPIVKFLSFLDDDIRIHSDYFENIRQLFTEQPDLIVLGGFDEEKKPFRKRPISSWLGITPYRSGAVARSGLSAVPQPNEQLEYCDFVPGGIQTLRLSLLGDNLFDESSSFFGEDIEMHLRLGVNRANSIACSSLLSVQHLHGERSSELRSTATINEYAVIFRIRSIRPDLVRVPQMTIAAMIGLLHALVECLRRRDLNSAHRTIRIFTGLRKQMSSTKISQ
jgi:glycosyltransferase involved in cell wall biosynthesis